MNINGGPNTMGLQHMAARAQEVRQSSSHTEPNAQDTPAFSIAGVTPPDGNNVPVSGENLPPTTGTEQSTQKPSHATGLEHAMERLQQHAIKSPEATGLQHALEMLQRNQEKGGTISATA